MQHNVGNKIRSSKSRTLQAFRCDHTAHNNGQKYGPARQSHWLRLGRCFEIVLPVRDGRNQLFRRTLSSSISPSVNSLSNASYRYRQTAKSSPSSQAPHTRVDDIQPQRMESGDHQPTRLFAPSVCPTRSFISRAALLVKVTPQCAAPDNRNRGSDGRFYWDNTSFTGTRARQHQAGAGNDSTACCWPGFRRIGVLLNLRRGEDCSRIAFECDRV